MTDAVNRPRIPVGGVPFDPVSRAEVIDRLARAAQERERLWIWTCNADHLRMAQTDPRVRRALAAADLVVADGMAVVYVSRLLGTPLPGNVGGRLLVPALAARAAQDGFRIQLIGGHSEEQLRTAEEVLRRQNPGLDLVPGIAPPLGTAEDLAPVVRQAVLDGDAGLVFVCLGTPKQEFIIQLLRDATPARAWVGVGATIDVLSGRVKEPPVWMTRTGLEWAHRLAQDPGRLSRRYLLGAPAFGWTIVRHGRRRRPDWP